MVNKIANLPRSIARRVLPKGVKKALAELTSQYAPVSAVAPRGNASATPSPYSFWIDRDNLLTRLGDEFRPTKRFHNYLPYYDLHFRDIRERVQTVVEIGLETDRSLRMWEAYFPQARIYGIDIDPRCQSFEGGRRRVFIGDQSDSVFLDRCLAEIGAAPDVIIDDGSHRVEHQVASFNHLFPRLSTHGVYVVEDTGGAVGDFRLRTVNRLKRVVDAIFYWPPERTDRDWQTLDKFPPQSNWLVKNVTGIAFYRWIVFVMRGNNPGDNPHLPVSESWYEPGDA